MGCNVCTALKWRSRAHAIGTCRVSDSPSHLDVLKPVPVGNLRFSRSCLVVCVLFSDQQAAASLLLHTRVKPADNTRSREGTDRESVIWILKELTTERDEQMLSTTYFLHHNKHS